jgi:superfamily II DNA helicase RecQ
MPSHSKVKQYQDHEVNLAVPSDRAFEVYGKQPFRWQLKVAQAILCGWDVVLDIGTGSGKAFCFTLPLFLNNDDISLTVSPLTALMINQAC